ncbi:lipase 3-like [Nylanderia fulva]|uniref:lipase 3-like n=1 Tax=Nylanderia fulva TaxID=613905 RepID=UPI0010FB9C9B|nr:lipase 3-like [Nylanderia fulva]
MLLPIFFLPLLTSSSALLIDTVLKNIIFDPLDRIQALPDNVGAFAAGPEDAQLSTMELIRKYGYNGELHKVTTPDGYILELHRITGRANSTDSQVQKPVAFVMHGLLCSSAVWVFAGPEKSLGFLLADAGYDVWLGNARGSLYSREHSHRRISTAKKDYWNFSWHEIGTLDLPTMIDYVLQTTGREKLFYLGHSQGTTSFFVMSTQLPEYQEKIEAMFAMAPIAYCGRMKSPFLQVFSQFTNTADTLMSLFGVHEFMPTPNIIQKFMQLMCAEQAMSQPICSNVMFLIAGFNPDQMDPSMIPVILGHVPAGASTKQMLHYGQLIRSGARISPGRFKLFDHGLVSNKKIHNSRAPPHYELKEIKVPISLHYSENDWLANVKDVEKLYSELGNPYGKFLVPDKKFNHLDYMWAKDVKPLLYDQILSLMENFK